MSAKRLALLLDAAEARLSPGDWQGLWVFVAFLEGRRSWFHVTAVTSIAVWCCLQQAVHGGPSVCPGPLLNLLVFLLF